MSTRRTRPRRPLPERLTALVNRTGSLNGRPFPPGTPMRPPAGRLRNWAHYGLMVPDLPEPHRFFGVMSIIGTPGVTVFANDRLITTTPEDTAYTVSATASMDSGQFLVQSIARDCDFRADGSRLRFGEELLVEGAPPRLTVRRTHPDVTVELDVEVTGTASHFAALPGTYRHWSLLARYRGRIEHGGRHQDIAGLCTFEYAAGAGTRSLPLTRRLKVPVRLFTYHVLNLDERTQALLVEVLGPGGFPLQRAVYLRSLDDHGSVHTRGFALGITSYEATGRATPDGRSMRLPRTLAWRVQDEAGRELLSVEGTTGGDFAYGLGAGFVGSYTYTGRFRGAEIGGRAYLEYVDCR
ncbi:hypothetical protein SLNWT_5231 [Streptomyces albus]|uniref:Uncharacterized protein n=1 Tax=Streptomyces albus (strain ATCC 21838 / DSM 41398 / FERM P-419 / JCM 4703 / NBRC 107858) TaxID=1081613 RepID=A0A0B5F5G5_STRA4|nr:hypothetical protein SLNWT_5231 [Streptomyces albus]AOU79909.1 hypothetical protein SLNHY_5218 [Streptomyces albus]AYN35626.1 hypothetical protein DUI70_5129 [Streptomyces albus]